MKDNIKFFLEEYQDLIKQGNTPEEALKEFDYLHPISLGRLIKRIKEEDRLQSSPSPNGSN